MPSNAAVRRKRVRHLRRHTLLEGNIFRTEHSFAKPAVGCVAQPRTRSRQAVKAPHQPAPTENACAASAAHPTRTAIFSVPDTALPNQPQGVWRSHARVPTDAEAV
ncbi:hypothetical protein [Kingella potus]|uniref:hypothetical protein n=1 Tax=Kingella potus TaxID=265175 RepID=UPI001FD1E067|nr:hypothetical protein [Kingella potus]UOP00319.1 hypothetical protein LVJ84_10480 [Kingella potus]